MCILSIANMLWTCKSAFPYSNLSSLFSQQECLQRVLECENVGISIQRHQELSFGISGWQEKIKALVRQEGQQQTWLSPAWL